MNDDDNTFFVKLIGISSFLEHQANLDENLNELLELAAGLINCATCSIMLFKDEKGGGDIALRVFAKIGDLPANAFKEATKVNKGIAGHVAATGKALLVEDIADSAFFPLARRPDDPNRSFISVPIVINDKVIGVINISNPRDGRRFSQEDLNLASFVALLVGKSIQVIHLQNLLRSRYAQLAVMKETRNKIDRAITPISQDPANLAKILAKSFYREMTRAGLGSDHIIGAATEIISLLTDQLDKHRTRLSRT